jgi:tRNA threonylcarbamoyladenosine biosynthesis protein TsaB
MNILAFDTCFGACSAAVSRKTGSASDGVWSRHELMATGHAERLVAMIQDVLDEAGLTVGDLDRIGVTTGPGTFAGTRICVAAARALAMAGPTRIFGLSSLAVMARRVAHPGTFECDIAIAVDVGRDQVYAQTFQSSGVTAQCEPVVCSPAQAAQIGGLRAIAWAGTGAAAVIACRTAMGWPVIAASSPGVPEALMLLELVAAQPSTSATTPDRPLSPLYLRPPDAKPSSAPPLARAQS